MGARSYINSAIVAITLYKGDKPFHLFIKEYFRLNKKFGSRDRKHISHLCYCFFRMGKSNNSLALEEKIIAGLFLCSKEGNQVIAELKPEWNENATISIKDKCSMLNAQFSLTNVFPWEDELSNEIEYENFSASFFIQPDLFLRLRPGNEKIAIEKLIAASIPFTIESANCLALPNASKLNGVIDLDKEAVIQDYSSQRVLELLQPSIANCQLPIKVWDCCAASGGKSILSCDLLPNIALTVSDVRTSILNNLKRRFENAGINNYKSYVADLSHSSSITQHPTFDVIICDAPCSGSGTWSRTPEQLYFFKDDKIEYYAELQKKIALNASKSLNKGGYFLYITCSVFKKENEEVVEYLKQKTSLQLKAMQYYKGYDKKADTLFAALFTL
jgi:16S rRNA (cytosine967-C5)-methyltransferase